MKKRTRRNLTFKHHRRYWGRIGLSICKSRFKGVNCLRREFHIASHVYRDSYEEIEWRYGKQIWCETLH